ncbi:MAG: glycosyltransferase [Anaerolineales bacterium]|nr:glycosyltransferase [Anaerolineales bacterium]
MLVRKLLQRGAGRAIDALKVIFPVGSTGRLFLQRTRASIRRYVEPDADFGRKLDRLLPDLETWAIGRSGSVFLILSPVQFREDEGQRATNLALEMVQRGIPVLFIYWRWPGEKSAPIEGKPGVLQIPMDLFLRCPERFLRSFHNLKRYVLFEYPHPELFGPLALAHAEGWITVYDLIDDWSAFQRVGQAEWYDPLFERYLVLHADVLLAVGQSLADRIGKQTGRQAVLIPNGLSPDITRIETPQALVRGEVTLGYFGYLSDAWFDWPLILEVAERHPGWKLYLIGYGMSMDPGLLPANVIFLGKKQRSELASYAANWDVGVIPFKQGGVARGADPIKAYEYLAMNLPVVATGVHPPPGGEEYVMCARDALEFARKVTEAAAAGKLQDRADYANNCSWEERLNLLIRAAAESPRVHQKSFLFGGVR